MPRLNRKFIFKILLFILILILCVGLVWGLSIWTKKIKEQKEKKELSQALQRLVQDQGETALLELANIPVDSIYKVDSELTYSGIELQNMSVYSKANKSVVSIRSYSKNDDQITQSSLLGQGSGFIYSEEGFILSCYHVVEGASIIKVSLSDGITLDAKIVGFDQENDIVVLKVSTKEKLVPLTLDTDVQLEIGQRVFAVGNPLGFDQSLSVGFLCGLGRPIRNNSGRLVMGMLQTDMSISSGSSGSPMLNNKGSVIGMMISTYSESGSFQAMSFAIPSSIIKTIANQLISNGKIERGWLDLVALPLTDAIVSYSNLSISHGLLVSQVDPNGKAAKAGVKAGSQQVKYGNRTIFLGGDIITHINGIQIIDSSDVFTALMNTYAGDKVELDLYRDGKAIKLDVILVERTQDNLTWLIR